MIARDSDQQEQIIWDTTASQGMHDQQKDEMRNGRQDSDPSTLMLHADMPIRMLTTRLNDCLPNIFTFVYIWIHYTFLNWYPYSSWPRSPLCANPILLFRQAKKISKPQIYYILSLTPKFLFLLPKMVHQAGKFSTFNVLNNSKIF